MPDTEALFHAILSATSDAVVATDQSGKIARVNESFEKLTGYTGDQLAAEDARTILGISKGLDLEIVAEGAEIVEHAGLLRDLGCDVIQGYFYSRPITGYEMEGMLRQSSLMHA